MTPALARAVRVRQNADVQNHSKAIIEALQSLPSWVDFAPDPNKWTEEQVAERMPVWSILPHYWKQGTLPSPKERLWLAICNGTLVGWDDRSHTTVGPSARGSLDLHRIADFGIRAATVLPPEPVLEEFRRSPFCAFQGRAEVTVIRNEWIERATAASVVREIIRPRLHETRRLIIQAGLDPTPLDELMKSTYMQDEVVDRAIAIMTESMPTRSAQTVIDAGPPARLTGKAASDLIGVNESTFSRWRSETPIWATSNPTLFQSLVERDGDRFPRERIVKLVAWWREALKSGGQEPTPCP